MGLDVGFAARRLPLAPALGGRNGPRVQGYTNREIAEQPDIRVNTVDRYHSRVMKRM